MKYPVIVHKDESTGYGVTIPDFPGCFTAGDTLTEALSNVQEAAELFFSEENLDYLPAPSKIEELKKNQEPGGSWHLVDIDFSFLPKDLSLKKTNKLENLSKKKTDHEKERIMGERTMRIIEDQGDGFYYDPSVEKAIAEYEAAYEAYEKVRNEKYNEVFGGFSQAWKNVLSQCSIDFDMIDPGHLKEVALSWVRSSWDHVWDWEFGNPGRVDKSEIASASWDRWCRDFEDRYSNWEKYIIKMVVEPNDGIEFNPTHKEK